MKMAEIDAGLRKWKVYIEKKKKRDIGGFTIVFI